MYRVCFFFILLALASSFSFPHIGEEGVYTLSALEMWLSDTWLQPTLLGSPYPRPPLMNWLMGPLLTFLGPEHMLLASRCLSISSSLCMSGVLYWLTQHLYHDKEFACFTALALFSADFILRRAWLAYADPLFASCTFIAMAVGLIAFRQNSHRLLLISLIAVIAGFLSKALTVYFFYSVVIAVSFYFNHASRSFFKSPLTLFLLALTYSFPLLWQAQLTTPGTTTTMFIDIITKYESMTFWQLLKRLLFPVDTLLRFFPISLFALLAYRRYRPQLSRTDRLLLSLIVLNYAPYWLSPETKTRYLLPLYPVLTLLGCRLLWQATYQRYATQSLLALWGITCCLNIGWLSPHERDQHGNADHLAMKILTLVQQHPLYINDTRSVGLCLAAALTQQDERRRPLQNPHSPLPSTGFLITDKPVNHWHIYQQVHLGRHTLFLLCRGAACHPAVTMHIPKSS